MHVTPADEQRAWQQAVGMEQDQEQEREKELQKRDAEMEQKQEQARRSDPVAAAVVGSHEYREERDRHKVAHLFQAAADKKRSAATERAREDRGARLSDVDKVMQRERQIMTGVSPALAVLFHQQSPMATARHNKLVSTASASGGARVQELVMQEPLREAREEGGMLQEFVRNTALLQQELKAPAGRLMQARVPAGISGGQAFVVEVPGSATTAATAVRVHVPAVSHPGDFVRFNVPPSPTLSSSLVSAHTSSSMAYLPPSAGGLANGNGVVGVEKGGGGTVDDAQVGAVSHLVREEARHRSSSDAISRLVELKRLLTDSEAKEQQAKFSKVRSLMALNSMYAKALTLRNYAARQARNTLSQSFAVTTYRHQRGCVGSGDCARESTGTDGSHLPPASAFACTKGATIETCFTPYNVCNQPARTRRAEVFERPCAQCGACSFCRSFCVCA
jgi:hypothetical protein